MARNGISYEQVDAAVKSLQTRGEDITINRVRRELGDTGSLTTIQRHLATWRSENKEQRPVAEELPEALESAFRRCLQDLWSTAQLIAQSDIERIRKAAHTAAEELERDLSDACDAHDQQSAELNRLRVQMEVVTRERDEASHAATVLAAEKRELERQFAEIVGRLEGRLSDLARVVEALSSAREATTPAVATKARPATKRGRPKKANA